MIEAIIYIALVGVVVYLIVTYVPMPQIFKTIIMVVAALFVILWLIQMLGLTGPSFPRFNR
jgi:hypothetical protein